MFAGFSRLHNMLFKPVVVVVVVGGATISYSELNYSCEKSTRLAGRRASTPGHDGVAGVHARRPPGSKLTFLRAGRRAHEMTMMLNWPRRRTVLRSTDDHKSQGQDYSAQGQSRTQPSRSSSTAGAGSLNGPRGAEDLGAKHMARKLRNLSSQTTVPETVVRGVVDLAWLVVKLRRRALNEGLHKCQGQGLASLVFTCRAQGRNTGHSLCPAVVSWPVRRRR